ncbi:hypothetical protein BH10BAC5_BH10BAC5_10770 [soil metagenome]
MRSDSNILRLITELCNSADKKLRVKYDKVKIENLRKKEEIIEFRMHTEIEISSELIGKISVKKIFIPVTGRLGVNKEDHRVNFFVGEKSYLVNPYSMSNKKVYRDLMKLIGK